MSENLEAAVQDICRKFDNDRTRMMDIVRAVQARFGCVSGEAMDLIAEAVGTHRVEVASAVSFYGVDVVATAMQQGATVFDLEEAELCYAPQFGAAKDPVNIAGMIAANVLREDAPVAYWEEVAESSKDVLLDVRDADEFAEDHVDGSRNIPLNELRDRMDELPREQEILVYCQVGQRAYYATRVLRLNGFAARNLTGGFKTYAALGEEAVEG